MSKSSRGAANSLCILTRVKHKLFWPRVVRKKGIWSLGCKRRLDREGKTGRRKNWDVKVLGSRWFKYL